MNSKNLHSGHRERLRTRFIETGISGFQEHEILELLLFYALPRVNTNEIAHRLITEFGSLSAVLDADESRLCSIKGISSSGALLIKYMRDLCRYYALSAHQTVKLSSTKALEKYISDYFHSSLSETSLILNLNLHNELISSLSFHSQDLLPEAITARELAELSLRNSFRRIVIARNSPNKPPVPTENDYHTLNMLMHTLSPIGIEIFDYIINSNERIFSMRKNGAFSFNQEVPFNK